MFQAEGTASQCKDTWAGRKEKERKQAQGGEQRGGCKRGEGREQRRQRAECGFLFSPQLWSILSRAVTGPDGCVLKASSGW